MNNWKTPNMFGTYNCLQTSLWSKNDMTYILGADCSDGVALIGDTRVTVVDNYDYIFSKKFDMPLDNKKLRQPLNTVIMGSSGFGGLYEEFKTKMLARIITEERKQKFFNIFNNSKYTTEEEFRDLASDVIKQMARDYGEDREKIMDGFFILSASRIDESKAYLFYFSQWGFGDLIKERCVQIGCGSPFANTFIKGLWKPKWTMEQTAKLGIFIIKYITHFKLDNGVGFSDEMLPQVVYLPHDKTLPVKELLGNEVRDLINEAGSTISYFQDSMSKKFKM